MCKVRWLVLNDVGVCTPTTEYAIVTLLGWKPVSLNAIMLQVIADLSFVFSLRSKLPKQMITTGKNKMSNFPLALER
jgi:membrane-anchored protein YejM (alkaline phosphatase superfamily)